MMRRGPWPRPARRWYPRTRTTSAAFEGAYGAFCVTNYWESMSPGKEISQTKNLAEATKASGVKHAI